MSAERYFACIWCKHCELDDTGDFDGLPALVCRKGRMSPGENKTVVYGIDDIRELCRQGATCPEFAEP